jgi:hypothetical protein
MKPGLSLWLLLFWLPLSGNAAADNYPLGSRQAAMGNTGVALFDIWSVSHNQAGLCGLKNSMAAIYAGNPYLMGNISSAAAVLAITASPGVFAAKVYHYGFESFKETTFSIAYSMKFGENLWAGVQLNYFHTSMGTNYGNISSVAAEAGAIYRILPDLFIGIHIYNPTAAKLIQEELIPVIFRMGLSYHASGKVILNLETEKDINQKPIFKAGLEYQVMDDFFARAGIGTQPVLNTFGIGLRINNIDLDISSCYHQLLGFSPQLGISYNFR